jgi:hypothetical protein
MKGDDLNKDGPLVAIKLLLGGLLSSLALAVTSCAPSATTEPLPVKLTFRQLTVTMMPTVISETAHDGKSITFGSTLLKQSYIRIAVLSQLSKMSGPVSASKSKFNSLRKSFETQISGSTFLGPPALFHSHGLVLCGGGWKSSDGSRSSLLVTASGDELYSIESHLQSAGTDRLMLMARKDMQTSFGSIGALPKK